MVHRTSLGFIKVLWNPDICGTLENMASPNADTRHFSLRVINNRSWKYVIFFCPWFEVLWLKFYRGGISHPFENTISWSTSSRYLSHLHIHYALSATWRWRQSVTDGLDALERCEWVLQLIWANFTLGCRGRLQWPSWPLRNYSAR